MNFKEIFKKFWFVILMALALLTFVVYYSLNLTKNEESPINTKTVDGKSVIYSINDENYFADELFDTLNKSAGTNIAYNAYKRDVISNSVKTTSEMEDMAASYAAYMLQTYGEEELVKFIRQYGYNNITDLTNFYVDQLKESQFISEFYKLNYDNYVAPVIAENNPRKISHILIKVADVKEETDDDGNVIHVANPTDEEKEKLDTVLNQLKDKTFAEVAQEYSEDGSASNGGLLGITGNHNANKYVSEFAQEAMRLNPGEVSEVITTQFGYHILFAESVSDQELLEDQEFFQLISDANPSALYLAVERAAEGLEIEIVDNDFQDAINKLISESEASN